MTGELACLAAAFLWAVSVGTFRPVIERHGARTVNLAKCLLAAAMQGLTVLALGQWGLLAGAPASSLGLVALSGCVGLAFGDTALFAAAARLGVSVTLLLQTLAPVFAAGLAWAWLDESLRPLQAAGGALVLLGVAVVVAPGRRDPTAPRAGLPASGIVLGVLAALGQGSGVVIAKQGMEHLPFAPASFLRLSAAVAAMLLLAALRGGLGKLGRLGRARADLSRLVPATVAGSYVALFLMMAGIERAAAPVAAVLLATTPVFALGVEAVVERRAPPLRGILGTAIALAGVALI